MTAALRIAYENTKLVCAQLNDLRATNQKETNNIIYINCVILKKKPPETVLCVNVMNYVFYKLVTTRL